MKKDSISRSLSFLVMVGIAARRYGLRSPHAAVLVDDLRRLGWVEGVRSPGAFSALLSFLEQAIIEGRVRS